MKLWPESERVLFLIESKYRSQTSAPSNEISPSIEVSQSDNSGDKQPPVDEKPQLGARCTALGECLRQVKIDLGTASGLKWRNIGNEKPSKGEELTNAADLASALASTTKSMTEFTQEQWDAFGISALRIDHFIKSGKSYFQPAETGESKVIHAQSDMRSPSFYRCFPPEVKKTILYMDDKKILAGYTYGNH